MADSEQRAQRRISPAVRAPSKRPWFRLALLIVVGAFAIWGAFIAAERLRQRPATPSSTAVATLPLVKVSPAERGPTERTLALPGDITAFEDSPVYARVNGYVKKWTVDIGARVKAGDLLAEIETPELDQQLRQTQALVVQAKANAEIARITYNRYLGLVKINAVSQQDVDASLAAAEARKADVAAAEAEVGRLSAMTAFQKIYAPFDGVIGARNLAKATTGALIDLGSHDAKGWLYRIYRMDPVRVYVTVPQNYLPMIKDGLGVEVLVSQYNDRAFAGRVVRNAAALDATSRTILVEIQVPNPDGLLLPGMYSTAHFRLVDPTPPIVVSDSSIIVLADGPQIAVLDKDDVVHIRKVRLGRDFGKTVEILTGVEPGERVVDSPSDLLKQGDKVRVHVPSRS